MCFAVNALQLPRGARSASGDAHRRARAGRARRANVDRRRRPRGSRVGLGDAERPGRADGGRHLERVRIQLPRARAAPGGRHASMSAPRASASSPPRSAAAQSSERSRPPLARAHSTTTFLVGAAGFSITLLVLAPVTATLAIALPLLVVLGICFTLFLTTANSLVQLAAPDHLRGRVISIYLLAFAGLAPAGGLIAGCAHRARRHEACVRRGGGRRAGRDRLGQGSGFSLS